MEHKLERKYGLFTAICLVVGIVIGSGVFFKAQTILQKTEGNMPLGIIAWVIGGLIMLVSILTFATMAQKYEKVNGIVDYAEATVGSRYGYFVGWFMTAIYYPSLTSVLCWLSARYTLVFITSCWPNFPLVIPAEQGGCVIGPECIALMMLFLCCAYFINAISPKLAGKFQTTTTIIKLIPLGLMAVVGIISGLVSPTHMLANNFAFVAENAENYSTGHLLLSAVCATAFAYEGWIIATSINAELKDAKRNLPKALIIGGIIIIAVYIAYYVGVAGGATVETLMDEGATSAFVNIFGGVLGNILNLFIAISCMGTLNGLMLATARGMYAMAARGKGPAPRTLGQIDPHTNVPANSAIIGLLLTALWFFFFYGSQLAGWFGGFFGFDSSELPIVTIYAFYLPIFISFMRRGRNFGFVRRFLIPALAILGSLFMIYAAFASHGVRVFAYLIVFAAIMLAGILFEVCRKKTA